MNNNIELYNNDFLEVAKAMPNNSIDCIVTDPPYGVNFKRGEYLDEKIFVLNNIPSWYEQWYRLLKNNCYLFVFVGVKNIQYWITEGIKAGFEYKNIIATRSFNNGIVAAKNNFSFLFQPILVFSKGRAKELNEVNFIPTSRQWLKDKRNKKPKPYTYVYPNFIDTTVCHATEKRAKDNYHPNEKNIKLIKFLIEISTKENEIVLDSFLGTGSTALAAQAANRKCIGIEINKKYFDIAKSRLAI